jgi:hypothetical protein
MDAGGAVTVRDGGTPSVSGIVTPGAAFPTSRVGMTVLPAAASPVGAAGVFTPRPIGDEGSPVDVLNEEGGWPAVPLSPPLPPPHAASKEQSKVVIVFPVSGNIDSLISIRKTKPPGNIIFCYWRHEMINMKRELKLDLRHKM